MPTKMMRRALAGAVATLLMACNPAPLSVAAQEPGLDTVCALDGMVLKDFPGSKAQVHYTEGKPDYYCDLMELFAVLLAPEHKRKVAAVYVQDTGKVQKCDLCAGNPACAEACPTGAITYVDADWTGLGKMRQWAEKLDNQPAAGHAD